MDTRRFEIAAPPKGSGGFLSTGVIAKCALKFSRALAGAGEVGAATLLLGGPLNSSAARLLRISGAGLRRRHDVIAAAAIGVHRERAVGALSGRRMPFFPTLPRSAKSGSVWSLRDFPAVSRDRLGGGGPGFPDCIAIVLAAGENLDVAEFYLDRELGELSATQLDVLALTTELLVDAWQNRPEGAVRRLIEAASGNVVPIGPLSSENPFGFSRSEYRVCSLLTSGLLAKAIATRLGVSTNTVRSHLRNIYAKTGARGQNELILLLLGRSPLRGELAAMPEMPQIHAEIAAAGR